MCARLLGRVLGTNHRRRLADQSWRDTVLFFAFRPAGPDQPVLGLVAGRGIRCEACGGAGAVDEVDFFSTYDELAVGQEQPIRRGPGRPPRQFRPSQPPRDGLATALGTLAQNLSQCPPAASQ
jgi:hypothetical protein